MYMISERRKHTRIEKQYIAKFLVQSNNEVICYNWNMVAVTNLSAGGIFFYAIENLEVNTILDLKIGLSYDHPSIICAGIIVRAKRHLDTSVIGFGIQFTEIDEHIVEVINSTIEKKQKINLPLDIPPPKDDKNQEKNL